MAFNKRTWKDRESQYPDRRKCVNVATGAVVTFDVTREEGQVTQEGTALNAATFNDLEDRISAGINGATLTPGTGISIENGVISVSLTDADTQEY